VVGLIVSPARNERVAFNFTARLDSLPKFAPIKRANGGSNLQKGREFVGIEGNL
jgi:hypothetical protein